MYKIEEIIKCCKVNLLFTSLNSKTNLDDTNPPLYYSRRGKEFIVIGFLSFPQ